MLTWNRNRPANLRYSRPGNRHSNLKFMLLIYLCNTACMQTIIYWIVPWTEQHWAVGIKIIIIKKIHMYKTVILKTCPGKKVSGLIRHQTVIQKQCYSERFRTEEGRIGLGLWHSTDDETDWFNLRCNQWQFSEKNQGRKKPNPSIWQTKWQTRPQSPYFHLAPLGRREEKRGQQPQKVEAEEERGGVEGLSENGY